MRIFPKSTLISFKLINVSFASINPQVNPYDALPKFICHICYNQIVEFHEFFTRTHTAQQIFLAKSTHIKLELTDSHDAPMVTIPPDDDFIDIFKDEPEVHFVDNYSGNESYSPTSDTKSSASPKRKSKAELSTTAISATSATTATTAATLDPATVQAVIAKHFEATCELCPMELGSLRRAIEHYHSDHKISGGFLKCCGKKLKTPKNVQEHVRWHLAESCPDEKIPLATKSSTTVKKKGYQQSTTKLKEPPAKKMKSERKVMKNEKTSAATAPAASSSQLPVKIRKRCYFCPIKLDRKVRSVCISCNRHTCQRHFTLTIKCHGCKDQPVTIDTKPVMTTRGRCVFCPNPANKARQVCFCCLKKVCGRHSETTHQCHRCSGDGKGGEGEFSVS